MSGAFLPQPFSGVRCPPWSGGVPRTIRKRESSSPLFLVALHTFALHAFDKNIGGRAEVAGAATPLRKPFVDGLAHQLRYGNALALFAPNPQALLVERELL